MNLIKRITLFLITNIAILILLSFIMYLLWTIFWISFINNNYIYILIFALVVWFWWSFISLFISKWSARMAYNIKDISIMSEHKNYYIIIKTIERLANLYKIKKPEIGIYQSNELNAFATGYSKNNSLVAVSTWLMDWMTQDEIEWVIWHEMAHIINGDMVTMTLLQWILNTFIIFISRIIANIITNFISKWENNISNSFIYIWISIFFELIFWILATLIVSAFSRHREYKADSSSALFV